MRNYLAVLLLCPAVLFAQPGDGAKYDTCAGSLELQKCKARIDALASETPQAKRARVEALERDRRAAAEEVAKIPITVRQPTQRAVAADPTIGMTQQEAVQTLWGQPESKTRTVTASGSREQWVYGEGRYLYFDNGRVSAITSRP